MILYFKSVITRDIYYLKYFFYKKENHMAKKSARETIKLKSQESKHCYWTRKNKTNTTEKLERKKYDPTLRKHVMYKEAK